MQSGANQFVEGDELPPYRIQVNYDVQPGGYQTLEDAKKAVEKLRRADKYISILHHRQFVWGKQPPKH